MLARWVARKAVSLLDICAGDIKGFVLEIWIFPVAFVLEISTFSVVFVGDHAQRWRVRSVSRFHPGSKPGANGCFL